MEAKEHKQEVNPPIFGIMKNWCSEESRNQRIWGITPDHRKEKEGRRKNKLERQNRRKNRRKK